MPLFVRGFFVSLLCMVVVAASDQGWDDKSCTDVYETFVSLKLIPKDVRTRTAFCKNQIDGDFLETISHIPCETIGLDSDACSNVREHLNKYKESPSSKFKDFWDWRAHNKRLSDYWLLPLSHSPRSLLFYLYFRSNDTLVIEWFNNQPAYFAPMCVFTPSIATWYLWDSDAIKKFPDPKARSFVFEVALFWGGACEILMLVHLGILLRKMHSFSDEAQSTHTRQDLLDLMWSSILLVVFCILFAYFHFYLLYLPFNIVFYLHLRVLWPLNALMYPIVIWALPTFSGLSLSSMIEPFINPSGKAKEE